MDKSGQRETREIQSKNWSIDALKLFLNTAALPLSPQSVHYARRAVERLAEISDDTAAGATNATICALHATTKTAVGKRWYEEQSALTKVLSMQNVPLELLQTINCGSATMNDALKMLEYQTWGDEISRIRGCYTRLEKILRSRGVALDGVPAARNAIDTIFKSLTHLDVGLQPAGWRTMRCRLRRLARLADIESRSPLTVSKISAEWRVIVENAKKSASTRGTLAKLWPLVRHCARHGITPMAVNDTVIAEMTRNLERREAADAFSVAQSAVYAWEKLARSVTGWPAVNLNRVYRSPGWAGGPRFADLPAPLRDDWNKFIDRFAQEDQSNFPARSLADLVADDLDSPTMPLSPAFCRSSIANLKSGVNLLAAGAISLGRLPQSLTDVVDPAVVVEAVKLRQARQILRARADNSGARDTDKNPGLLNLVSVALSIARRIDAPRASITRLEALRDRVDHRLLKIRADGRRQYRRVEMGGRHRTRIAAFNDAVKMHAWLELPFELLKKMSAIQRSRRPPSPEEIGDAIVCVIYAVSLCCPMRRKNLAALRISGGAAEIWLPPNGRGTGRLRVPAVDVKNNVDLNAELDVTTVKILTIWLDVFRPALMQFVGSDPMNPYLLPAKKLQHRADGLLNKGFVTRNRRAGLVLNLHCMRHLCAKVILDQDPTQMELVRQMLGHTNITTTERYYADVNAILAQKKFHLLLEARRNAIFGELSHDFR
ncbi:MAG TPA: site-specific integrase [Acidiphilium sp.]|nr:site-specific integrase [Acidiphilium sp.]